jgi:hypothetical protein
MVERNVKSGIQNGLCMPHMLRINNFSSSLSLKQDRPILRTEVRWEGCH